MLCTHGALAPPPGQCGAAYPVSTYPKEFCGTQVLLGDTPAELLYVSDTQINFKVPQDAPQSGTVDIRVVYTGQFSRPLAMKAGFEQTTVSLDGPAYTGMPVWLKLDLPFEWNWCRPVSVHPGSSRVWMQHSRGTEEWTVAPAAGSGLDRLPRERFWCAVP